MKLQDFQKDDGYEDSNGCWYESAESLIQSNILGFCGCGCPEENLIYVMRGLELIAEKRPDDIKLFPDWYKEHRIRVDNHFKNSEAEYFFYYWADKEGFTDHGSSVPGWLSDYGKDLIQMIKECYKITS